MAVIEKTRAGMLCMVWRQTVIDIGDEEDLKGLKTVLKKENECSSACE